MQRNRHKLVTAAREAFNEQGPQTSLEEIARRAGVGATTLYRHFADKDDLVRRTVHHSTPASRGPAPGITADDIAMFIRMTVAADDHAGRAKAVQVLLAGLTHPTMVVTGPPQESAGRIMTQRASFGGGGGI